MIFCPKRLRDFFVLTVCVIFLVLRSGKILFSPERLHDFSCPKRLLDFVWPETLYNFVLSREVA